MRCPNVRPQHSERRRSYLHFASQIKTLYANLLARCFERIRDHKRQFKGLISVQTWVALRDITLRQCRLRHARLHSQADQGERPLPRPLDLLPRVPVAAHSPFSHFPLAQALFLPQIFPSFGSGEVTEWPNVLAWKVSVPHKGTGGSNPPLSAIKLSLTC